MRKSQMAGVTAGAICGMREVVFSRTSEQSRASCKQYQQWLMPQKDRLQFRLRKDSVEFPSGGRVEFTCAKHTLDGVVPENVICDELDEK